MSDHPVAIIGLGLMGEVYAQRLIDAGIAVTGYDIDPKRRARLAEIGGCPVDTIAETAASSRCIIVAVFNTDQVEDVIENHLLPALGDGSNMIVLCIRGDPDQYRSLAIAFHTESVFWICRFRAPAIKCAWDGGACGRDLQPQTR